MLPHPRGPICKRFLQQAHQNNLQRARRHGSLPKVLLGQAPKARLGLFTFRSRSSLPFLNPMIVVCLTMIQTKAPPPHVGNDRGHDIESETRYPDYESDDYAYPFKPMCDPPGSPCTIDNFVDV
ncbi:uncharacterized protein PODANS_5_12400 [Podospora anserina S mat+]|uniref:Podospora anserina S mat+ genomic DNA chromosome 5, supercontig 7 n=1 Tax=Podospora anserina (strain S / ATCC MYA-4624 / DSM 980 / FGSC 10383) TaxID=515849 RepID=B2AFR7_PODAN|nr:uncharacterized protein PODANS_5_12400 [Podospora anserina S mat+]CAP62288.1 unnamed protein product [Podospora anserina S mat+]CDP29699.1 Putative protein of unknown function [Podospora anserina S mat+]